MDNKIVAHTRIATAKTLWIPLFIQNRHVLEFSFVPLKPGKDNTFFTMQKKYTV